MASQSPKSRPESPVFSAERAGEKQSFPLTALVFFDKVQNYTGVYFIEKVVLPVYIRTVTVNNQVGLHARPATFFIQKANEFKSSIWIEKDERRINAKSLLGVLSLGIIKGMSMDIAADGPDEQEAVEALEELINSNFSDYES